MCDLGTIPQMRLFTGLVVASLAFGCEDEAPPVPTANAPAVAETPTSPAAANLSPSHGGTIVSAGPYPIEVVPHASGHVRAYLPPGVEPPDEAELRVDLTVEGRQRPRPVRLRWDADEGCYAGRVRRVAIVPGPIAVHYEVHHEVYVAHAPTIIIAPAIDVHITPAVRVKHRKHRKHHMGMRRKHRGMRHKHRGGIEIEFH